MMTRVVRVRTDLPYHLPHEVSYGLRVSSLDGDTNAAGQTRLRRHDRKVCHSRSQVGSARVRALNFIASHLRGKATRAVIKNV